MKNVVIVAHSDFEDYPYGGITSYCRNLLPRAGGDSVFSAVGITCRPDLRLGHWQSVPNLPCQFLPLLRVEPGRMARFRLPLKIAFSIALMRHLGSLTAFDDALVVTNDIEPTFPLLLKRPRGARIVTIRHGIADFARDGRTRTFSRNAVFLRATLALEAWVLPRVDGVIVVSHEGLAHYRNRFPHRAGTIAWIPTGVDIHRFQPHPEVRREHRRRLAVSENAPCVFTAARLEPEKGLDLLIRAFALLHSSQGSARLIIAGDGSERTHLESVAGELGIRDAVRFIGTVTGNDMVDLLNAIDVYALSSYWEGMPVVALEALSCGKPVVATNVGDLRTAIVEGETGYLCDTRDPASLAAFLDRAWQKRREMMPFCRRIAVQRSSERMTAELLRVAGETRRE